MKAQGPRDIDALHDLALRVGNTLDIDREVEAFLEWVEDHIRPRWVALFLLEEATQHLRLCGVRGTASELPASLPVGEDPWRWLEARGLSPQGATPARRYAIPIAVEGRLTGMLCVVSGKRRASRREQELVQAAAAYLGAILQNIRRYEHLAGQMIEQSVTLAQIETLFHSLVEQSIVGVALIDQHGRLAYVNPALAAMLGYERDTLTRQGVTTIVHPSDQTHTLRKIATLLEAEERLTQGHVRLQHKDKRVVHALATAQRVVYQGEPHVLAVLVDITEQVYAEEAYRTVAERTPIGMTILQQDRVIYVNPAFARAIDHPAEKLEHGSVPQLLEAFIHPEDRERAHQYLRQLHEPGFQQRRWTFRYQRSDGSVRWAQAYGTAIQYRGAPAVLVTYIDITRQKEAEQQLQRHARYLQALNLIVTEAHRVHNLQELLETIVDLVMKALDTPMGGAWLLADRIPQPVQPVVRGLPPHQTERAVSVLSRMSTQGIPLQPVYAIADWHQPPAFLGPFKEAILQLNVQATLSVPIKVHDRPVGHLTVAHPQPHTWDEEEIALLVAVGDELGEVVERLLLIEDLQEALAAKDEMIQNVSHELRTPLTLIRGYLELMAEGNLGPLSPEQQEAIQVMLRNADRQQFMIDRLLLMQQLPDAEPAWEPIRVESWLREVAFNWHPQAQEANVSLQYEVAPGTPPIWGDRRLLTEMMDNLIHNAIKFSARGGTVRLRAWREGNRVIVAVSDQGIGIPSDQLEKIFERFYQVSRGLSRRYEGLGIGLALCAEIARKHGGDIWAESKGEGQGATFYVRLPTEPPEAAVGTSPH